VLNFTRGWTKTDCWNEIRNHFKRSATRKSGREPHRHTRGFRRSSLFCDTREVRCRNRRKASPPRGVILYSECTPGDVAFSEVILNLRRESRTRKEERMHFASLDRSLKFEVHGMYICSNEKFAQFVQKLHYVSVQLEKGRRKIFLRKGKDFRSEFLMRTFMTIG